MQCQEQFDEINDALKLFEWTVDNVSAFRLHESSTMSLKSTQELSATKTASFQETAERSWNSIWIYFRFVPWSNPLTCLILKILILQLSRLATRTLTYNKALVTCFILYYEIQKARSRKACSRECFKERDELFYNFVLHYKFYWKWCNFCLLNRFISMFLVRTTNEIKSSGEERNLSSISYFTMCCVGGLKLQEKLFTVKPFVPLNDYLNFFWWKTQKMDQWKRVQNTGKF